jgi:P-type Cu+ transporter
MGKYTCPMHSEVIADGPGDCSKCGMALEPVVPSRGDDSTPEAELREMTHRFLVSAVLTVPLLVLAMGDFFNLPIDHFVSAGTQHIIELLLATPVVLWGAWPLFMKGWLSVVRRALNMFTLIGLGVSVAYAYSVMATLFPGVFPDAFRAADGSVGVYFEAAAVIVALVLLGQVLELRARQRTGSAIKALLGLAPKTARRVAKDGAEEDVLLEHVQVGDILRVRPGEKVPVDGVVLEGRSTIDESMVTGESMPVSRQQGDALIGSTVNTTGSFLMRADRVGSETLLAQIVRMVAEAQRSRAPIQKLVDVVSGYFVPSVILIAAATFVVWAAVGPDPRLAFALINAVAVLIIACPCALGLATPMSVMVSAGRAATAGVLFKDAEAIEHLRKIDTLIVDKTGTLTEGKPKLVTVESFSRLEQQELLHLAASLERGSEHPLAEAIVTGAEERTIVLASVEQFESFTGKGVVGVVAGKRIALGNQALVKQESKKTSDLVIKRATMLRRSGQTVMFVVVDGEVVGLLGVADPIKETTAEAIQQLHASGIRIVMLTGDHHITASAVAEQLGIDEVRAGVLPEQKQAEVRRLQQEGRVVAMAGDGVNDAPALAAATVGIAMGTGTDVAMESAGITLVKGDLRGIVRARKLSHATMRNIRQNLFFAFGYNAIGIPIAAGVLYPVFGVLLSPMIAAAAMSFSSVSVIVNALRLRSVRIS